ncbi:MAG: 2Fe-2S iron-sulfur cluster-binding protein [Pseudomonadota bacterium]
MVSVRLTNGVQFDAEANESILDAGRRNGVILEYSCRTARCGSCMVRVQTGETRALMDEQALLENQIAEGWVLSCARAAVSDVVLETEDLGRLASVQVKTLPCRIDALTQPAPDILQVVLRLPSATEFVYLPGQYINVIVQSGVRRSYSLANAPRPDRKLELHIRAVPGGELSDYWFATAKINDLLRLEGPFGTFCRREKFGKIIFLVTGTGFAPAKAMLEELMSLPQQDRPPAWLYWGGRHVSDIYHTVNFPGLDLHYVPVLSWADSQWMGRRGHVQEAALQDHVDFSDAVVYACGSDAMIHAAREKLVLAGLPYANFHSDAFVASN